MKTIRILFCLALVLCLSTSMAMAAEVVNVFNWQDYIDEDVLAMFTEETGIVVNYMCFDDNEKMMTSFRANPSSFDLIFPSDYCVERMIAENLIAPINFDNVPNFENIFDYLKNPSYDETNAYSVPYMWGTVGILYNTTMVDDPVDSWSILWNEKYKGNVIMLDSIRDTMGITLKYLGYSMNTRDPLALQEAANKLIEQKKSGMVKAYQLDETKDKMPLGEAALALMWSGDAQYAIDLNEDLAYAVPAEGSNIWVDAMVIPTEAKNKENAEKLIDFLCRPDIAVMNCEYIRYSSPNAAAVELMGDEYIENSVLNPDEETVESCEFFHDIQDFMTIYNTFWSQVKNAK